MKLLLTLSALVVAAGAGVLVAGDHLHGRSDGDGHVKMMMEHMFERIGASDAQRRELETAHERHDEVSGRLQALMADAHERVAQAIHGDPFDEEAIRAAAAEYAAVQADLFVAKGELLQQAREILTPDQLEEMREMHTMMGEAQGHHRGHDLHGDDH